MTQTARKHDHSSAQWKMSGLGMELAASIIGMAALGWAIDRWMVGHGHLALLICSGVGIIGGGYNFIRQALALNQRAAAEYKAAHPHGSKRANASADFFERREGETAEEDDDDTISKLWSDAGLNPNDLNEPDAERDKR